MNALIEDMPDKLAGCAFTRFLSKRGIGRVLMDDIASSAGVTKGSLSWHYQSKSEVFHAVCRHYYTGWTRRMDSEIAKAATPAEKLARAIRSSVRT